MCFNQKVISIITITNGVGDFSSTGVSFNTVRMYSIVPIHTYIYIYIYIYIPHIV